MRRELRVEQDTEVGVSALPKEGEEIVIIEALDSSEFEFEQMALAATWVSKRSRAGNSRRPHQGFMSTQ